MALSRAEIELVIKARNQAKQSFDEVGRQFDTLVSNTERANEAIEKHETTTKKASTSAGLLTGAVGGFTALLADRAINTIGSAVTQTLAYADAVTKAAGRTGLSTDAVQRFDYAAKANNVTLEAVTQAVADMSNRLAGNDRSAQAAMRALGLDFERLKQQSPERAFLAITEQLRQIPPGMKQVELANKTFGESGTQILAAVNAGFEKLGSEADRVGAVMRGQTIRSMAELNAESAKLTTTLTVALVEGLGPMIDVLPRLAEVARDAAPAIRAVVEAATFAPGLLWKGVAAGMKGLRSEAAATGAVAASSAPAIGNLAVASRTLSETLSQSNQRIQGDIQKTGYTLPQLTKALDTNKLGFREWATQVGLSADAIAFVEDRLRQNQEAARNATAARKKAAQEATEALKKQETAERALQDSLEQLGTPTMERVNQRLDEMLEKFNEASKAGLPSARAAALALRPELEKLAEICRQLFGDASAVTGVMEAMAFASKLNLEASKQYRTQLVGLAPALQGASGETRDMIEAAKALDLEQRQVNAAFTFFGERTPGQLRDARQAAERNYQLLVASGRANAQQLQRAYQQMVDAQIAESGRLPSFWQQTVAPGVLRAVETTETAVSGSFAQMLLGAKSFGEGWLDIWRSIQAGTVQIVNQMFSAVLQASFTGLKGALAGQSGAWSRAFSGLGQAGSTAGAAALGSAGGGGAITSSMSGGTVMGGKYVGASSGVSATTVSSLAGAAGGGIVGGMVGYNTGNTALGMTAGAATGVGAAMAAGAMKGAAFGPWGIVIGAGAGLVAGYVGAALRKRKERKLDREADKELAGLQKELLNEYGSVDRIQRIGETVGVDLAGAWGSRKREGLEQFQAVQQAFEERQQLLTDTMDEYGLSWENLGEKARKSAILDITDTLLAKQELLKTAGVDQAAIVKAQAGTYNELIAAVLRTGDTLPDALQPVLRQLTEMGLLTDENKRKLLGMSDAVTVDFKAMEEAAKRYGIDLNALGSQFQGARISADAKQIWQDFDMLVKQGADVGGVLFGMREEIGKVVTESLKFGTEIPENMRPLIEELARSGNLLDENGNKIGDLSRLKFAQPLEEGFDKVVAVIDRLGSSLTTKLPADAAEARRRIEQELTGGDFPRLRVPIEYDMPGAPPGPDLPGAANGIYASGPTFRVFAEKEPELGGPVSFMTKVLAGAMEKVGAAGSGPQVSLSFSIGGGAASDLVALKDTIRRDIVPEIVRAVSGNVGGARSNLRTALGVS